MAWAPDYITVAELKGWLRIPEDDDEDDVELALDVAAASRAVDNTCNRQFGSVTAEERYYDAEYDPETGMWFAVIDDLQSTTGFELLVDGTEVTAAGYRLEPRNAAAKGRPWTSLAFTRDAEATPTYRDPEIAATAPWGWTAYPAPVKLASRIQASRYAARRDSPLGVAGSPDMGNELRLLAKVDPDLRTSLMDYSRPRRPR